ncbi:hypothetical protein [Halorussus sp. AFM4]|uniref:hypothetical protein n=1 Tax=Halorussus sp. AFM4 TaxID=3421651 RepID=UPI003EBB0991
MTGERVKLLLYNDGDRVADQKPFPIPVLEDIPKNCVTQAHNQTNIEAPIVMPPIVHHILSHSPGELIDAAQSAVQE